ncbi:hypothetical protein ACHAXT_012970 [Thalassiosira profunda]
MPRFGLPKLRGRSRSVARSKRGARLEEDGGDEPTVAATPPTPLNKALSSSTAASSKLQEHTAARRAVSPDTLPSRYTSQSSASSRPLSPTPLKIQRGATEESNMSGYSNVSYDQSTASSEQAFTSAFTRSPPSFDNLDADILGERGVFPQPRILSRGEDAFGDYDGGFPAAYAMADEGGFPSNNRERLHSLSYSSQGSHGEPLGGAVWGDSSLDHEGPDDENSMVYSQATQSVGGTEESADPPATLLLEEDDVTDDEAAAPAQPADAQMKQEESEWSFDAFGGTDWNDKGEDEVRRSKNRRLVSPSPMKAEKKTLDKGQSAWGDFDMPPSTTDDAFGGNFFGGFENAEPTPATMSDKFTKGGFDDDGFGDVNNFFGTPWADVNTSQNEMVTQNSIESDQWETSFVNGSFNYSHEDPAERDGQKKGKVDQVSFEEKKEDDAACRGADPPILKSDPPSADSSPGAVKEDPPSASSSPSEDKTAGEEVPWPSPVWDGQTSGKDPVPASHPLKAKQHPLKPSYVDRNASQGSTVVSQLTTNTPSPTTLASAKQLNGHHRRMESNGSQSSRRKKGGGSVSSNRSNSSAVDQILEHYRQKRRNKNKLGGYTAGGSGSPGTSQPKVVPTNGSGMSGSGRGHRRHTSSGSSSSRQHRRNPSSESVSSIIDNLKSAAAAVPAKATSRTPAATAATRNPNTPNPAVGAKFQPPTANSDVSGDDAASDRFLLANIEATLGSRGAAPDMESLTGRSSAHKPRTRSSSTRRRPNRSPTRSTSRRGDASVDSRGSRASRNSFRTYQSTRSILTNMSRETQSVANDLFRLEAQLAEQVERQQREEQGIETEETPSSTVQEAIVGTVTHSTSSELSGAGLDNESITLGAQPSPRHMPYEVVAPPGKLGIILSNKPGRANGPTHVSAVRSESVLAGRVHVGDLFVSIDGEDVTGMNSKEITIVMARKSDFERLLRFRPVVDYPAWI